MNPVMLNITSSTDFILPELEDKKVSPQALKAAEALLRTDQEPPFIQKQKMMLAAMLDEIGLAAQVREKISEIERKTGFKSLALIGLEKTARQNGWL